VEFAPGPALPAPALADFPLTFAVTLASVESISKWKGLDKSLISKVTVKGENIFDALVKLMGKPIDRYLQPTNP